MCGGREPSAPKPRETRPENAIACPRWQCRSDWEPCSRWRLHRQTRPGDRAAGSRREACRHEEGHRVGDSTPASRSGAIPPSASSMTCSACLACTESLAPARPLQAHPSTTAQPPHRSVARFPAPPHRRSRLDCACQSAAAAPPRTLRTPRGWPHWLSSPAGRRRGTCWPRIGPAATAGRSLPQTCPRAGAPWPGPPVAAAAAAPRPCRGPALPSAASPRAQRWGPATAPTPAQKAPSARWPPLASRSPWRPTLPPPPSRPAPRRATD
mmetsp:Transcript_27039/g.86949  ORF Transcript_27039/g.86949 Transcript_27039/m.86949 type:complete len:268 (-) Transcript_27039:12-815(-)